MLDDDSVTITAIGLLEAHDIPKVEFGRLDQRPFLHNDSPSDGTVDSVATLT